MGVFSTNLNEIASGGLISASHASDLYEVLSGSKAENIVISGSFTISSGDTTLLNTTVTNLTASALSASFIDLTSATPSYKEGRIFYDADNGALGLYNNEADVVHQLGQEFYLRGRNDSGATITNGTPVRVSGSQGDIVRIWPAVADDVTNASYNEFENHIIGVATHDIEDSSNGYVTTQGIVRGIDTRGFSAGDILFLQSGSPATALAHYRTSPPPFPYETVTVGKVARSANDGQIFVEPLEPTSFGMISGLSGSTESIGDIWVYQTNGAWANTHILSGSYTVSGSITMQDALVLTPTTSLPSSPASGSIVSYTSAGVTKPYYWDGATWNALY